MKLVIVIGSVDIIGREGDGGEGEGNGEGEVETTTLWFCNSNTPPTLTIMTTSAPRK